MMKSNTRLFIMVFTIVLVVVLSIYISVNKTNVAYWFQDYTRKNQSYTLLLGSSSIDRLPKKLLSDCIRPVVYGFSNGTTESVQSYLDHANLKYASKIVLYIGENDIAAGEDPLKTLRQLQVIVDNIKKKSTAEIALVKLKYSPARAKVHVNMLSFNQALEKQYLNVRPIHLIPFDELEHANWFVSDGVHLNKVGNQRFAEWINEFCYM